MLSSLCGCALVSCVCVCVCVCIRARDYSQLHVGGKLLLFGELVRTRRLPDRFLFLLTHVQQQMHSSSHTHTPQTDRARERDVLAVDVHVLTYFAQCVYLFLPC